MTKLTRSKPPSNIRRFYAIGIASTLFGQWGLVTEWGRIALLGRVREQLFDTEPAVQAALTKRLRIKTRRGYIQASWETV
jgi:predicted DNA-binding WGR domain protein